MLNLQNVIYVSKNLNINDKVWKLLNWLRYINKINQTYAFDLSSSYKHISPYFPLLRIYNPVLN